MTETFMQFEDSYRLKGKRKELVALLKNENLNRIPIADAAVLKAVETIPRHWFFGNDTVFHETQAYEDKAFPIGEGQTISQPYTVAFQTQLLEVKPGEKILEIGTGSGYQAAVLMFLKAKVFTIERHKVLHDKTSKLLAAIRNFLLEEFQKLKTGTEKEAVRTWKNEPEYWSVKCFFGDGFKGLPAHAPFDKILITAAVPELPKKLLQQLCVGGKLVMPFGTEHQCKMLRITKHSDNEYETEEFGNFAFVPMLKGKVK